MFAKIEKFKFEINQCFLNETFFVFNNCFFFLLLWKAEMVSNKNPEQLLIALEPEAASIHCREMKMREFANEKGDATASDVFARPGSKYLVIDIGGKIELSEKWTVLTMSHYKISKPFLIFNGETVLSL